MFKKLFFGLCFSLLIALSSPSVAEEAKTHVIQGYGETYEIFGTKEFAARQQELMVEGTRQLEELRKITLDVGDHTPQINLYDKYKRMHVRDKYFYFNFGKKNQMQQKVYEAIKTLEDKKDVILQGIIKTSDENVKRKKAKDAEAKKIEEERLAKYYRKIIAAAELKKKIADRNAMVDAKAKRDAEKMAERRKMAQDLAADKARRLREYEKGKAINVASIALSLLDEFNKGPKDPNIIKSITEDGIVRTLHCNPGPCTPGSVILHGNISGLDMGVPVNAFAKQLKVHMADRKPEANINVNEDLELIDFLTAFNDVEVMNESEAESDEPNDINLTRALSIPKGQVEENKQAHIDSLHDNDVNPLQHGCWWC